MPRPAAVPRPAAPAADAAAARPAAQRRIPVPRRYDLAGTVGPLLVGRWDPTGWVTPDEFCRAARTPEGPGVVHLQRDDGHLLVGGYGPGASWLVERAEAVAGLQTRREDFRSAAEAHPVVARLAAQQPEILLPRSGLVFQELVGIVLQQKVTYIEAVRSYSAVVRHFGEPAPGPYPLLLPPDPGAVAEAPYWVFHPFGVEQRRADTLRRAAQVAARLEETVDLSPEEAARRLRAVAGIGPWTVGELGRLAYGDPDAVSVGDFHLPNQVAWTLEGRPRADDACMLELLEPFTGHRGRVIRLIVAAGPRAPKRGPRYPLRSFARF